MRWFKVHSYLYSLRPLYFALKVFLFNFETIDFENETLHRSLLDQFRFVLTILLDIYLVYKGMPSMSSYLHLTDSNLVNLGCFSALAMSILFSVILAPKFRFKANAMFTIYKNIAAFDRELRSLGYQLDHQRFHFLSTVSVCLWMNIGSFVLVITGINRSSEDWLDLSELLPDWISILAMFRAATSLGIFTCTYCLTLYSLNSGYDLLQQAITKQLSRTTLMRHRVYEDSNQTCQIIRRFACLHDLLSDTVELFNDCYCSQTLHALTAAFEFTVFSIFSLIHSYAGLKDEITRRVAWATVMFNGFYVMYTLQMIVMASVVNVACKRSAHSIHKAIAYGRYNRKIIKELDNFSQQLFHRAPKITCKLFDLDWTLPYTMAGSFTTYLLVLLQFDLANLNYS